MHDACRIRIAVALIGVALIAADQTDRGMQGRRGGDGRVDNGLKMKVVWCPPGKFVMGSPEDDVDNFYNETQVEVTLSRGFWLGKYEVTQSEWEAVMGTTPWKGRAEVRVGPTYAATYVSWDDADAFCKKLTEREMNRGRLAGGWRYYLPTEAQWEFACRAGTTTRFCYGNDVGRLSDYGWWGGGLEGGGSANGEKYAHQVGLKKANRWGLHDMHGNVFEWCRDRYAAEAPGGLDPEVTEGEVTKGGMSRVCRSGAWFNPVAFCRSASRCRFSPGDQDRGKGFRVALAPVTK